MTQTAASSDLARITAVEFDALLSPPGRARGTRPRAASPRSSSGPSRSRSATASATSSCT